LCDLYAVYEMGAGFMLSKDVRQALKWYMYGAILAGVAAVLMIIWMVTHPL